MPYRSAGIGPTVAFCLSDHDEQQRSEEQKRIPLERNKRLTITLMMSKMHTSDYAGGIMIFTLHNLYCTVGLRLKSRVIKKKIAAF